MGRIKEFTPKWTEIELAWLAGLLEGEGTFTPHRQKSKRKAHTLLTVQARVQLQTNDKDVAERVARMLDANCLGPYLNTRSSRPSFNKSPSLCWVVSKAGNPAATILRAVLPYMGQRRTRQITEALAEVGSNRIPLEGEDEDNNSCAAACH